MVDRPEGMTDEQWSKVLGEMLMANSLARVLEDSKVPSLSNGQAQKTGERTEKGIRNAVQQTLEILLES